MKKLIALLLALVMVMGLIACGNTTTPAGTDAPAADNSAETDAPAASEDGIIPASEMEDPYLYFTQFDEPQELHIAWSVGTDATATLEGDDTVTDNYFTRWLLENYNIKVVYDWTAGSSDAEQKLSMAISSDTLPDAWICSPQQWKQCAKNGQLYDITDLYYLVAENTRSAYEAAGKDKIWEACSYDGALTSITGMTVDTEGASVLMINKDWLDQLGLEVPKTISDVYEVAKAFKEAKLAGDATIPILGPGTTSAYYLTSTFYASSAVNIGLDAIFGANGAFPGYFYEEDGEIIYGTLTQETRDTLELLAQWYAEGLLDPEIGIRSDCWAPINANECGMFFGGWWNIGYGNPASFANDENANWQAYPIYNDAGEWETKIPDVSAMGRLCINSKATEEAAMAALIVNGLLDSPAADGFETATSEDSALYPLRMAISASNFCDKATEAVVAELNGTEDISVLQGDSLYGDVYTSGQYAKELVPGWDGDINTLDAQDFVKSDENTSWQALYSWLIGNRPYATVERAREVIPCISYMTESMEMYWDNLYTAEQTMMLSIITGEKDITAFDEFVEQWYAEGGETILAEVKAEVG